MTRAISDIENAIRNLGRSEQERLLRFLLEELDGPPDPEVERLWLEEVQRRSRELEAGQVTPIPSKQVLERLRKRL